MKKILLLGGTGAMGIYLTPELLKMGYKVDVVSLDERASDNPMLTYTRLNALDNEALEELLKNGYDAIVDFLIYRPAIKFKERMEIFLKNTKHYIYLSSYRIYADKEHPIKETSPRLLDVAEEKDFMDSKDTEYSLYKAMGEDWLEESGYKNWTVIRPAITYSSYRFQLITLEADLVVERMRAGKPVVVPKEALDKKATMSWAGDVAKMISLLVLNDKAYGERYTVSTSESHTWREVAEIYRQIGGLEIVEADKETFLNILNPNSVVSRWQLEYDRLYDRVIDNSKILEITGMKQEDLMPLYDGLKLELSKLPEDFSWGNSEASDRMDEYLKNI